VTITGIDKISTLYSTGFIRVEFIKHDTCTLHRKTASVRVITVATAFNHDRSLVFRARRSRETEQRVRGRSPASATYTLNARSRPILYPVAYNRNTLSLPKVYS